MEWSKEKTIKLIELLQVNATLWNPTLCESRKQKQKRKEELRSIASVFNINVCDASKKIQHLRTQYNREAVREARANAEDPDERYVSNWYAFEYLHFLKDSSKPYRVILHSKDPNETASQQLAEKIDYKLTPPSPKIPRIDTEPTIRTDIHHSKPARDEFTVFGEYIANELRTLKGEKNLLVAKKKIQDAIFEVKIGMMNEPRIELTCASFPHSPQSNLQNGKLYTPLTTSPQMESIAATHTSPTSGINEIIINGSCHYSNFKVDNQ